MVSTAEIRKGQQKQRQQRSATVATCMATVLAVALHFVTKTPKLFCVALALMVGLLIYSLFQLSWVREATPRFSQFVRAITGMVLVCGLVAIYGWIEWPPRHRHFLEAKELTTFQNALQGQRSSLPQTIQFCCPSTDMRIAAHSLHN